MASISCNDEKNLEGGQLSSDMKRDSSTEPLLPQDVPCDSCMDGPTKALKSCLTCLVSYCEAHLRPHLENSKFQNHRLVDPRHDVDCRTCEVHQLPLERFCLMDGCCVCRDCEEHEHGGHCTASMGEARSQIEEELQKKQEEINQNAAAAEKEIRKLQSNNDFIKGSVQEVCVTVEQQFARLQTAVDEARKGAAEMLEAEQRQALRQAEGIQAHLEQRKTELMKTLTQINKLSRSKSEVDFLQEYSEWEKGVADVCLPTANINRMEHLNSFIQVVTATTQEMSDLIVCSYREKLNSMWKNGTKSQMPDGHPSSMPDPETREDFLKYARRLTFDPDTTHHFLRVMENNRKLTNTSPWQHSYPDHPARFTYWRQAVTLESLYQGRHYVEAELSGEGSHVGVSYKSIDRHGEQDSDCVTRNDSCWCMGRNSRGFSCWHAGTETPLDITSVTKVGIFVDFEGGSVSFYNAGDAIGMLHRYTAEFIEPLYIIAWLSKKDNTVVLLNAK